MRKTWYRTQGNEKDKIVVPVTGESEAFPGGTTAKGYVERRGVPFELDCDITGQTEVTVLLGEQPDGWLPTCESGDWRFSIKIEFPDGSKINWPNGPEADRIVVRPRQDITV